MTRVNIVPPEELTDQHLFSEFREIKMVPKLLARSLKARGLDGVIQVIPEEFTLNKGHVTFFYDKGYYLVQRYKAIRKELDRRGRNYNKASKFDPDGVYRAHPCLRGDYEPTPRALRVIRRRLKEKIAIQPDWYKYEGKPLKRRR